MTKKFLKIIINLIFIILILLIIVNLLVFLFGFIWLQTYKAFTGKTYVAQITVQPLQTSADGKSSFTLTYKQVKSLPLNTEAIDVNKIEFEEPQTFTLQGNEFRIGGQILKVQNFLSLLGVKTVFKINRLESSYLVAADEEKFGRTVIDLGGGVDNIFIFIQQNESLFRVFIDTAMGDYPGKNVQNRETTYDLFVTEEGFLLTLSVE